MKREGSGGGLTDLGAVYREDGGGTLHEVRVYREDSGGTLHKVHEPGTPPSGLTVTFNPTKCEMDLSWSADPDNSQDIYRCNDPASGCSVFSLINTVAAGVSSYADDVSAIPEGDFVRYYIDSAAGESNKDEDQRGTCP